VRSELSVSGEVVETQAFLERIAAMGAAVADPRRGFFGPGSISWMINREPILHIAGPRALLMQLAHPLVARGVQEHSNFEEDLYGRTIRTFTAVYAMVFGDVDEALWWARRVHQTHCRVRGEGYQANDPRLLLWVFATLLDSALFAFEAHVRPLRPGERERHYDEMRTFAGLFGLGEAALPPSFAAFGRYLRETISGGEIEVSEQAHDIAWQLLRGRHVLKAFGPAAQIVAAGMLAPALREGYGLRWDRRTAMAYNALMMSTRHLYRHIPPFVRAMPMAWEAELRVADSTAESSWLRSARSARRVVQQPLRQGLRALASSL
jgi:uncharacterized protein (DUF2236 family)